MKKTGAVLLVLLLTAAGCSTHSRIDASFSTGAASAAPPAGTSVTTSSAGLQIHSHSLAAVVIAGMFMAAAIDHAREPRPFPSFSAAFGDWFRGTPAPELDPARSISEQDCTRPIELSGNLKCR
jgi:hypothetical protein